MTSPESPQSSGGGYTGPVPPGGWAQSPAAPMGQMPMSHGALAGWGSRVGATLLDGVIVFAVIAVLVLLIVAAVAASDVAGILVGIVLGLAALVVALLYAPILLARKGERNGQTYGKQAVGIRVVRDTGQPFEMGAGFLREFVVKGLLFGTAGGILLYIPTLVDWLWPLWDDENRTLHDMVVSTHVVRA